MVERIRYLVEERHVEPKQIMAVTFTNKAAGELKDRLAPIVDDVYEMWIGTIHSICVRLLKELGPLININKFSIMDPNDCKATLKGVLEKKNLPCDKSILNNLLNKISYYKNNMITASKAIAEANDDEETTMAEVYKEYQEVCLKNRTFDFDDLIVYVIALLTKSNDAREWVWDNIKYISIDEIQDNSNFMYILLKLMSGTNNVFLIGDQSQSLYSFRFARPELLYKYKDYYIDTKLFYLEQNYRSTKTIVEASNAVIVNNHDKFSKTMFTENEKGEKIIYYNAENPYDEAQFVTNEIKNLIDSGINLKEIAVLYRKNAQSRVIEDAFIKNDIFYQIYGSFHFYDRKEIKDMLAYFKFYVNNLDVQSFKRILKIQEGIGDKTVENIIEYSEKNKVSLIEALKDAKAKGKAGMNIEIVHGILTKTYVSAVELFNEIFNKTNYMKLLETDKSEEAKARIENLNELVNLAGENNATVEEFVDRITLMTDGLKKENKDKVSLSTIHLSKGLEFSYVFFIGLEEGTLPSYMSLNADNGLWEERNAMYVGMTRAKKQLYLSSCKIRTNYGGVPIRQSPSRFLDEIPKKYIMKVELESAYNF